MVGKRSKVSRLQKRVNMGGEGPDKDGKAVFHDHFLPLHGWTRMAISTTSPFFVRNGVRMGRNLPHGVE